MDALGQPVALILLLALGQVGGETPAATPPAALTPPAESPAAALTPPPVRAPIAGLGGFESRSRVEYLVRQGQPHELRATYAFPARVRWWFSVKDGEFEERRLRYRTGPHVLAIEPGRTLSIEFEHDDRAALLGAFELRRALFLWPDGFEWRDEDGARATAIEGLGRIRARLGEDGRPVEIEFHDARGELKDNYKSIRWSEHHGRTWPAAMEMWNSSTLVWREVVETVDVATRYTDAFFVPPDRRGLVGTPIDGVRALDIPPLCTRRIALAAGSDWAAARRARAQACAQHAGDGGDELETIATFELGAHAEPVAIHLRLARPGPTAPKGFELQHERTGLAARVDGTAEVSEAEVSRLRGALPRGAKSGTAYARFEEPPGERGVVLVLPYE